MSENRMQTVKLSAPLQVGGKEVWELTVRPSTIGDEEDAMQDAVGMGKATNPLTAEMALLARIVRVPYDALRGLSSGDYLKLRAAFNVVNGTNESQENPTPEAAGTPEQA
ncbi:phage tail assembly protein [Desulfovibrio sp.]|uniref:phage tail assembly protein n=1 Tax=Desulfovibrio sp. TaxID=885 RepID=UPI003AB21AFB